MNPVAAVVVAGGSGARFGREGGKQLVSLAGRPVVAWSLEALSAVSGIELIVLVCPWERHAEYVAEAIEPLSLAVPVILAPSGATRQESVLSGMNAVPSSISTVLVHDGARPLVAPSLVESLLAAFEADPTADGVIVGHPSVDTLKVVESGVVAETPDRCRYWAVQTPQVFARTKLEAAHAAAIAEGFVGTDDAALVERRGGRVLVVEGPRDNIKVTMPEDLAFVAAVLEHRRQEGTLS